jgi:gamma-glutamylcyclotransferase (GGCT)/AIG2-like uncharacterized protein YtfP
MRALSIRQPWASLILAGLKKIETRSTTTHRRGRVFLHAAATMGPSEREAAIREGLDPDALPRGVIVGTVDIVDSVPVTELDVSDGERRRGDYRPGRWGWMLTNVRKLATPVPAKGALSFWRVPKAAAETAEAQLPARVFVYGTLKRGHGNHALLERGRARYLGRDRIEGSMHSLGAFPAVTLAAAGTVHGELYEVSPETLRRLDRLEGTPSFYQRTRVSMSTGMEAWVYVMTAEKLAAAPAVASGCWENRR